MPESPAAVVADRGTRNVDRLDTALNWQRWRADRTEGPGPVGAAAAMMTDDTARLRLLYDWGVLLRRACSSMRWAPSWCKSIARSSTLRLFIPTAAIGRSGRFQRCDHA